MMDIVSYVSCIYVLLSYVYKGHNYDGYRIVCITQGAWSEK